MSRWTSERAIERDLWRAQGAAAAGSLPQPRALRAAERPPCAALHEETDEEYFKHCAGEDAPLRPDLGLIQQMLNMVRDLNVPEDEFDDTVAVISKLNPDCPDFIPTKKPLFENLTKKKGKFKKIRQRNIALESILQALECQGRTDGMDVNDAPLKLLKPEDLIPNSPECGVPPGLLLQEGSVKNTKCSEMTSQERVKDWLTQTQTNIPNEIKPVSLILESSNIMFRRKSKPTPHVSSKSLKTDIIQNKARKALTDKKYIPSTRADDYYKKYLEKSWLMESLHNDIWTKAEKKMKLVDEKRRLAAEQRAAEATETAAEPDGEDLAVLRLFQARVQRRDTDAGWARVRLASARHPSGASARCPVCAAVSRAGATAPSPTPPPQTPPPQTPPPQTPPPQTPPPQTPPPQTPPPQTPPPQTPPPQTPLPLTPPGDTASEDFADLCDDSQSIVRD